MIDPYQNTERSVSMIRLSSGRAIIDPSFSHVTLIVPIIIFALFNESCVTYIYIYLPSLYSQITRNKKTTLLKTNIPFYFHHSNTIQFLNAHDFYYSHSIFFTYDSYSQNDRYSHKNTYNYYGTDGEKTWHKTIEHGDPSFPSSSIIHQIFHYGENL